MIKILSIKELQKDFNCKDVRTIKVWCKKRGISVFSQQGRKQKFVLAEEFERIRDEEIKSLTSRSGKSINRKERLADTNYDLYVPKSNTEIAFLSILQSLKPEL